MTDLMTAVSSAKKLHDFVNSGSLGEALAEIELDAACKALEKNVGCAGQGIPALVRGEPPGNGGSRRAESPRQPVCFSGRHARRRTGQEELDRKRAVTVVLLAIAYKYLGEEKLCMSTLDRFLDPPAITQPKSERQQMLERAAPLLIPAWLGLVLPVLLVRFAMFVSNGRRGF